MDKKASRLRRARKGRSRISDSGRARLTVFRTPRHIYAQVFSADGTQVLCSASTVEKSLRSEMSQTGNTDAAAAVGAAVAKRCIDSDIREVAFDRSGFAYHGRVKALAEAARENGLSF